MRIALALLVLCVSLVSADPTLTATQQATLQQAAAALSSANMALSQEEPRYKRVFQRQSEAFQAYQETLVLMEKECGCAISGSRAANAGAYAPISFSASQNPKAPRAKVSPVRKMPVCQ